MNESLQFALQLTVVGMGMVFGILALLGGLMVLLLRLDHPPKSAQPDPAIVLASPPELDSTLAAAITVAVLAHRQERRKEAGPEVRSLAPGSQPSRWLGAGRTRQNQTWQPRRPH